MTARLAPSLLAALVALGAAGCDVNATLPTCEAPDASSPVASLAVSAGPDPPVFADKATIPLLVTADIPCLRGGATASLTTSTGTVGGNAPGKPFELYLAPAGDAGDTRLVGYVDLVIAYDRIARVDAAIGEATAIEHFGPYVRPADAGAPEDAGADAQ